MPNPSALFLAELPDRVAGSAVLCAIEGSRPLLVEVQALVSTSTYGYAKRTANGLDANRVSLLLAVLEKRAGLVMSGDDVFANVAGGLSVDEPAVDLAVVAALASSLRNRPVRGSTALFGEVGLAGEVRGAPQAALRVREAAQMGFNRIIVPDGNVAKDEAPAGCELVSRIGLSFVPAALIFAPRVITRTEPCSCSYRRVCASPLDAISAASRTAASSNSAHPSVPRTSPPGTMRIALPTRHGGEPSISTARTSTHLGER